jgi:Aspartyl/Asparaginyl beta-hydroxylase
MSKIFQKLNIDINLEKAIDYYLTLERDYQHKKWTVPVGNVTIHGYAIQGIKGRTGNFGLYEDKEPLGIEHYFDSELAFGWGKDMLNLFPMGYRAGIGSSPPGTIVPNHVDFCGDFAYRLHIPIITNEKYIWTTPEGKRHLPVGSVYLFDSSCEHATRNDGDEPRVHFGIAIPKKDLHLLSQYLDS